MLETYSLGDFNDSNFVCDQLDEFLQTVDQLDLSEAAVAEIRLHADIAASTGSVKKALERSSYDEDMRRELMGRLMESRYFIWDDESGDWHLAFPSLREWMHVQNLDEWLQDRTSPVEGWLR